MGGGAGALVACEGNLGVELKKFPPPAKLEDAVEFVLGTGGEASPAKLEDVVDFVLGTGGDVSPANGEDF